MGRNGGVLRRAFYQLLFLASAAILTFPERSCGEESFHDLKIPYNVLEEKIEKDDPLEVNNAYGEEGDFFEKSVVSSSDGNFTWQKIGAFFISVGCLQILWISFLWVIFSEKKIVGALERDSGA